MSENYKKYRRESGMARFERECSLIILHGRAVKAYNVPGTAAAGTHAMYRREFERILNAMMIAESNE